MSEFAFNVCDAAAGEREFLASGLTHRHADEALCAAVRRLVNAARQREDERLCREREQLAARARMKEAEREHQLYLGRAAELVAGRHGKTSLREEGSDSYEDHTYEERTSEFGDRSFRIRAIAKRASRDAIRGAEKESVSVEYLGTVVLRIRYRQQSEAAGSFFFERSVLTGTVEHHAPGDWEPKLEALAVRLGVLGRRRDDAQR